MIRDFLPGITRVFSNVTPILIFFIFAQIINVQDLGILNYVISFITIAGIFTDFGIPEAIQRFLPQTKNKARLITHTIKLEFLIVFIVAILFLIFDLLSQNNFSKGYLLLLVLTIIFSASNTIILIFNGLEEKKAVSKYFAFSALIFLLTTIIFYFVLNFNPILSFIYGRAISWLIYTIIPFYELSKRGYLQKEAFGLKKYPKFNKFAINTFIYLTSIAIITQWDSILITNVDGAYTNGIYKSVAFIATIPIVLVTILHTRLLPFFSKLNGEKKYIEIFSFLSKNMKYLITLLFVGYIISLLIYQPVLNIALDAEIVEQAGFLFPVILLAVCVQILLTPFVSILQAIGKEKFITQIYILKIIIFLAFSTIMYSTYSYAIFPYLLLILNTFSLLILGLITYTNLKRCNIKE